MLSVLKFILNCIAQLVNMLFSINIGFTSLGVLLCIIYIFLPIMLKVINFLKYQAFDDLDMSLGNYSDRKQRKKERIKE